MEMFRHRAGSGERFTQPYDVSEIEPILKSISIYKILEDDYEYSEAKITAAMARDLQVMVVGELVTLWKNEFRNLPADLSASKCEHRTIGLKLIKLVHIIARWAV